MSPIRLTFADGITAQATALDRIAEHVEQELDRLDPQMLDVRTPTFLAMGASHAALAGAILDLRAGEVRAERALASEASHVTGADLVVAVSQGGRSAETLAALESVDVPTLGLVNVADSPLEASVDVTVGLGEEPDSYASTVGLTGTCIALERLTARMLGGRPSPWVGIGDLVRGVVADATPIMRDLAVRCTGTGVVAADVVASGAGLTVVEAVALLLREVVRLPATPAVTRNYLHGAMESAGRSLHIVVGDGREVALARTLAGAGHLTLLVTTRDVERDGALEVLRLPEVTGAPRTVAEIVALQVLAGELAAAAGVDVEAFVFANDDTKAGGVDPGDFAIASPRLDA